MQNPRKVKIHTVHWFSHSLRHASCVPGTALRSVAIRESKSASLPARRSHVTYGDSKSKQATSRKSSACFDPPGVSCLLNGCTDFFPKWFAIRLKSHLHMCELTLAILSMPSRMILAWLTATCHSSLIINVPSSETLSPTAWSKVACPSILTSCFTVTMAFVHAWSFLDYSSVLHLQQILVRPIQLQHPA